MVDDPTARSRPGYGFLFKKRLNTFTAQSMMDDDFIKLNKLIWEQTCCLSQKYAARDQCVYTGLMERGNVYYCENATLLKKVRKLTAELVSDRFMKENAAKSLFEELKPLREMSLPSGVF